MCGSCSLTRHVWCEACKIDRVVQGRRMWRTVVANLTSHSWFPLPEKQRIYEMSSKKVFKNLEHLEMRGDERQRAGSPLMLSSLRDTLFATNNGNLNLFGSGVWPFSRKYILPFIGKEWDYCSEYWTKNKENDNMLVHICKDDTALKRPRVLRHQNRL